jgi:hypothetical protein
VAERIHPRRLLQVSLDVFGSGSGDRDSLIIEIRQKTAGYSHVLAHAARSVPFCVQMTSQLRKPIIVVKTQVRHVHLQVTPKGATCPNNGEQTTRLRLIQLVTNGFLIIIESSPLPELD